MLKEGVKGTQEIMVTEENTAKVMGSGALDVFATPAMIALMEKTAWESVHPCNVQSPQSVPVETAKGSVPYADDCGCGVPHKYGKTVYYNTRALSSSRILFPSRLSFAGSRPACSYSRYHPDMVCIPDASFSSQSE